MNEPTKQIKVLVSAICFINREKTGSEIYATYTSRQILDVMIKTPHDYRLITNEPEYFNTILAKYSSRVTIIYDKLEHERISVGRFNYLLKYKALMNIPSKYDWVLYLDCDTGISDPINISKIDFLAKLWDSQGYDIIGTCTNRVVKEAVAHHEYETQLHKEKLASGVASVAVVPTLFSEKFIFYNVSLKNGPFEWMEAKMPSEHVLFIKNNEKMQKMAIAFQDFNRQFETQSVFPIGISMEAFEIGVSAHIAGYNMGDFGNEHNESFKVIFNGNNWENKRY